MRKELNVVLLNDTRSEHHHGCSRVMNCIDYYLKGRCAEITYSSVGDDWQKSETLKNRIVVADIVIVNGEGTIHHNSSTGLALVKVASFAKKYGVKSYLINTTYQSNDSSYKKYLDDFEQIFVRESYSKAELTKLGIDSKVVPDLTFSVVPEKKQNSISGNVLVTCSVKSQVKSDLEDKFGVYDNVLFLSIFNQNIGSSEAVSLATRLVNIYNNNTLAQLVSKMKSSLLRRFVKAKTMHWSEQYTHVEYAEFLSQAQIVICGRFHAMTVCMNHGIPFLAIESNSHKISGTLNDIGLTKNRFLVTPELLTMDYIENFETTKEEYQLIEAYAGKAKSQISAMFEQILA